MKNFFIHMHPASCNRVENGAPQWARRQVSKAATEREQSTRRVALSAASVALCPSVSVWQRLCVYLLQLSPMACSRGSPSRERKPY